MNQQEIIKAEFEKQKKVIEGEVLSLSNKHAEIVINLNSEIKQFIIRNKSVDPEVLLFLNMAISNSKNEFEKKWTEYLTEYGLKF